MELSNFFSAAEAGMDVEPAQYDRRSWETW